jgi:hypothetical protein
MNRSGADMGWHSRRIKMRPRLGDNDQMNEKFRLAWLLESGTDRGRGRFHTLRENRHVEDRRYASGEDALTVRGVGSRRPCNYFLANDLVGDFCVH